MALHTDLPIYKVAYDLLDAITDLAKNMPRDFKQSIGGKLRECLSHDGMYDAAWYKGKNLLSITPSTALLAHDNEVAAKALEEAARDLFAGDTMLSEAYIQKILYRAATARRNRK